jgi:hypothetical protein
MICECSFSANYVALVIRDQQVSVHDHRHLAVVGRFGRHIAHLLASVLKLPRPVPIH